PEQFRVTWSVGHKRPGFRKITLTEYRGQSLANCKGENARAVSYDKLINCNVHCVGFGFEVLERRRDIVGPPYGNGNDFEAEPASLSLRFTHLQHGLGVVGIEQDGQSAKLRHNLTQDFNPLPSKLVRLDRQSSHVASRFREARDQTGTYRIDCHGKYDGNSRCRLFHNRDSTSHGQNDIGLELDELGRNFGVALRATFRPAILDCHGTAFDPAEFAQVSSKSSGPWSKTRSACA